MSEAANSRLTRQPAPVYPGISDSVRVTAGDLLFVSGAIGLEPDGALPDTFERAVELTYGELERALRAGGADFRRLIRVNVYISGLDDERLAIWRRIRDRMVGTDDLPASTLIGVASLVNGAQIEIDAIAAV